MKKDKDQTKTDQIAEHILGLTIFQATMLSIGFIVALFVAYYFLVWRV